MGNASSSTSGNVIRFPVERRFPRMMTALFAAAPDAREVGQLIDTWNLSPIGDTRRTAEETTADIIAKADWTSHPERRNAAFNALLHDAVNKALEACRLADEANAEAAVARIQADQAAGNRFMRKCAAGLEERASSLGYKAAWLMQEAHGLCEAAQSVARAIDLAKRNQPWVARTVETDTDWLCAAQKSAAVGRAGQGGFRVSD